MGEIGKRELVGKPFWKCVVICNQVLSCDDVLKGVGVLSSKVKRLKTLKMLRVLPLLCFWVLFVVVLRGGCVHVLESKILIFDIGYRLRLYLLE